MKTNKSLDVYYEDNLVGKLAMTANSKVAFEYSDAWGNILLNRVLRKKIY